jgi:hypothetical protein
MFTQFTLRGAAAALGVCALALPLHAQQRSADDPQAAVPATHYQPAWVQPAPQTDSSTPDRNWQALNRTVAGNGASDPHAGHAQHGHHAAPEKKQEREQPAAPDPHAHHHGEHH